MYGNCRKACTRGCLTRASAAVIAGGWVLHGQYYSSSNGWFLMEASAWHRLVKSRSSRADAIDLLGDVRS